jgi:hypothetical protein
MPNPAPITAGLVGGSDEDTVQFAVTSREPDRDVHPGDVPWWLAVQERTEIRTEMAARGLL